jgi:3-phenylpropionate/trans-cinnamate dioxygenase ferredoxin subunit
MTRWIDIATEGSLAPGEPLHFEHNGLTIAVFLVDGEVFAIEDICSHDRSPISDGCIDGREIICPRHGARFCLQTGQALTAPAYEDIETFPVRTDAGRLWLGLPD